MLLVVACVCYCVRPARFLVACISISISISLSLSPTISLGLSSLSRSIIIVTWGR